jgi:hypothetical protein
VTRHLHYIPGSSAMVAHDALAETGSEYALAGGMWDEQGLDVPELG